MQRELRNKYYPMVQYMLIVHKGNVVATQVFLVANVNVVMDSMIKMASVKVSHRLL